MATISLYGPPVLFALFIWWFSTGVIIYLDNLPRTTHRWSMAAATVVLAIALRGLSTSSGDASLAGAYAAFTYGLLAWGWHEMSFFMGFVTGPSRKPCPPDSRGWDRFRRAVEACLYHELASLASAAAVIASTSDGVNQVGTWTFMVLWSMRLSSKFNVFLGVRNLSADFIPEHLAFIRSFLRQRPMNLLFPFSVSLATVFTVLLVQRAGAASASTVEAVGNTFIATLLILAILEHWFLVLPIPAAALWKWSLRARQEPTLTTEAGRAARTNWTEELPLGRNRLVAVRLKGSMREPQTIGGDR